MTLNLTTKYNSLENLKDQTMLQGEIAFVQNEDETISIKIGNKEVTRYQASQLMRQTETKMRYKKDEIITLETAGISALKERQQLRDLQSVYRNISSSANLQKRYDRAYVPGFKK